MTNDDVWATSALVIRASSLIRHSSFVIRHSLPRRINNEIHSVPLASTLRIGSVHEATDSAIG